MRISPTILLALPLFVGGGINFACSNEGDGGSDGSGAASGDGDGDVTGDGDGDDPGDGDAGDGDGDSSGDGDTSMGGTTWMTGGGLGCEDLQICGPAADEDCCARGSLPSGTFPMGMGTGDDACPASQTCGAHEGPEHDVSVSGFNLDMFEVTVGRFRAFVGAYDSWAPSAGDGAHPLIAGSGYQSEFDASLPSDADDLRMMLACHEDATWTDAPGQNEAHPINCVSWTVAFAFCAWDGGRLPTEAEWEFAAASDENRLYPWGSAAPSDSRAAYYPAELQAAGQFTDGAGWQDHRDLAGNVWEWALDWLDTNWYSGGGADCSDCARVSSGTHRVIRGGGYSYQEVTLRAAARSGETPDATDPAIGFRCAYDD